jgi:hypothetical protein
VDRTELLEESPVELPLEAFQLEQFAVEPSAALEIEGPSVGPEVAQQLALEVLERVGELAGLAGPALGEPEVPLVVEPEEQRLEALAELLVVEPEELVGP